MILFLKVVSEGCFSFNVNVNTSLKFLSALAGLSEGTQALWHSKSTWALGHSKGTRGAFKALDHLGHSGNWRLRTLGTQALEHLGHTGTWALGHSKHFV